MVEASTLCVLGLRSRFRGHPPPGLLHVRFLSCVVSPPALRSLGWQHTRSRVFVSQAIDSIHQVGVYCLALVPANTLPKAPLGGIHISETKQRFLEGTLHPCNVLMCPHTCVTNLPKPRQKQPGQYLTARLSGLPWCWLQLVETRWILQE